MRMCSHDDFVTALKPGDIGLIQADNFFGKLQSLYAAKFDPGPLRATHGFYVSTPPDIIEANGLFVSQATILKDVGDSTKCWVFRYPAATPEQIMDMTLYCQAMVDGGSHYGILGIAGFALRYLGIRKKLVDQGGVFCTELTSLAINRVGIPYIKDQKPFEIDPSDQLNWFMGDAARALGWQLAANYDGSNYFVSEPSTQEEAA